MGPASLLYGSDALGWCFIQLKILVAFKPILIKIILKYARNSSLGVKTSTDNWSFL
jgi:hypothetical protein